MITGFIDNDILLKLTAFRLLKETMTYLELPKSSTYVLSTARFFVLNQQRKQQYPDDICNQAIAFINSCQSISDSYSVSSITRPNSTEPSEFQQLAPFSESIDIGETELIVATGYATDFVMLSSDKRCFKPLPQIPSHIYARLQGRAVCLEQLVLKMINVLGFEVVCDRIYPATKYDKAIELCFGYSQPASESQVREALASCIRDIHTTAPGLLMKLH